MKQFKSISDKPRIKRISRIRPAMSLEDTIKYCIKNGFKMDFLYQDDSKTGKVLTGYRSVSPAALGTHKNTGNRVMRAYLNEGVSLSKRDPKWRMFRLDRIASYNIHYQKNKVGQNKLYRENDKHMSEIDSQIKKALENLLC